MVLWTNSLASLFNPTPSQDKTYQDLSQGRYQECLPTTNLQRRCQESASPPPPSHQAAFAISVITHDQWALGKLWPSAFSGTLLGHFIIFWASLSVINGLRFRFGVFLLVLG